MAKRKITGAEKWVEDDPNGFALALEAYERDIVTRYGYSRRRGVNLYEGDHWTPDEKDWADQIYFPGISDNMPVRNRYRRKVDHIAAMLSPGAPIVQFTVGVPPSNTKEDQEARKEIESVYEEEWMKMIRASEYQVEISRLVKDAENQHTGWVGVLPLGKEKELEFIQIPAERIIFDIGVTRLRHLKWIAWVDLISKEQAEAVFGKEVLDGVQPVKVEFDIVLRRLKNYASAPEDMLTLIHFYALKDAVINTQKAEFGAQRFNKGVHITQVGDKIVHKSTKVPKEHLPITHLILESDMADILGKGLSETADDLQAHLDRVVLHQTIQMMKNDIDKRITYGLEPDEVANLKDPTKGDIAVKDQNFKVEQISKPILDNTTMMALDEAKQAFDENTGMFAVGEGERAPNIPSASGQMFLANVARTPINAKARYLAETIRACGEIFMGWQKVWNPAPILKDLQVQVDIDSLLELTTMDKYQMLLQLAEVGVVDNLTLIENSPLPLALKRELVAKHLAMQQQQQQLIQQQQQLAAQQAAAEGGGLAPGMEGELPAGVETEG